MLAGLLTRLIVVVLSAQDPATTSIETGPLPDPAAGWSVEQAAEVGQGLAPASSALATTPDGGVLVGLGSLKGERNRGSIVVVRSGLVRPFASDLGAISGLEWIDGTLFVLQGTRLTSMRDTDGDGLADDREDLVTGLGGQPATKAADGPVAAGLCLGLDGRLYFAVDDRGLWQAAGRDQRPIRLRGGGVVRVRRDGTELEVVSTGERRPRSLAVNADGDVFTIGEPDASGRWKGGLTYHVDGGHYGWPYQFLTAPFRSLPTLGGGVGGADRKLIAHEDDRLPETYRGNLWAADGQAQGVVRFEPRKAGGTFTVARKTTVLQRGKVVDFHPVALCPATDSLGFWVADGASPASRAGRIYRLSWTTPERPKLVPGPRGNELKSHLDALDHPSLRVRQESQAVLARLGEPFIGPLIDRVKNSRREPGRLHGLWALDAIGTAEARTAIREALGDDSPRVRSQAARSCGLERDRSAVESVAGLLNDTDPAIRREAAIALGRIGDRAALAALMEHLGETDRSAAWSVRTAIRRLGYPDRELVRAALCDPSRRESALILADESWSVPVVQALADALTKTAEPAFRGRIVAAIAGQYRAYEEWTGEWWGPTPLAAGFPKKTRNWSPEGQSAALLGLSRGLADQDATVRFQSVFAMAVVGQEAAPLLRTAFGKEADPRNQQAMIETLGAMKDPGSTGLFQGLVADGNRPEPLRAAALDALAEVRGPDVLRVRFRLLYDPSAPPSLVARALPPLARGGFLPANDLAGFIEHPSPLVRQAAILSLSVGKRPSPEVSQQVLARFQDQSADVRGAAILAAGVMRLTEAIPKLIQIASKRDAEHRSQAISALCQMPDSRALAVYKEASQDDDPALQRAAQRALQMLPPASDPSAVTAGMAAAAPVADINRLRRFALTHSGDPRKGEQLFRAHRGSSCAPCHATTEDDRVSLGKRAQPWTKTDLIDALLKPASATVRAHEKLTRFETSFSALEFTDLISYLHGEESARVERAR